MAPTELTATITSKSQIDLSWKDNSTNETGYKIERKTDLGVFAEIGSSNKDITIFSDKNVSINTKYTYRVYSYNEVGKSVQYSNEVIVKILDIPILTTTDVTEIKSTVAKSGGNISSDGGSPITSRGVVWSTTINPTIALSTKTNDASGTGTFQSSITGLTAGTKYYVRAYATNSEGTSYGNELSFTTLNIPTLTTVDLTGVATDAAKSGGNISSDGGSPIISRGVVWNTTTNPTITLSTKTNDGSGSGIFQSYITGLTAGTKYFVRAYATNSEGTAYGNELSLITPEFTFVVNTVTSKTGRIWLDRNLGARQVATSSTDVNSYGDLYQWGRLKDGHELRTSTTSSSLSSVVVPGHSYFIVGNDDWLQQQNNNLWQGAGSLNNACPVGFRLPTLTEWEEERKSWISNDAAGAFASPLKLPTAGDRSSNGVLVSVGFIGDYWSSTITPVDSYNPFTLKYAGGIYFKNQAFTYDGARASGCSVRCIKN